MISDGLPSARRAVAAAVLALAGASAAYAAPDAAGAAPTDQAAPLTITVRPGQSLNDIAVAVTQSHDPGVLARAGRALFDANPQAFMKRERRESRAVGLGRAAGDGRLAGATVEPAAIARAEKSCADGIAETRNRQACDEPRADACTTGASSG